MQTTLEGLGQALEITLAVFVLVVAAMIIYICWLLIGLHRHVRRFWRSPEVARDRDGRPIKERV